VIRRTASIGLAIGCLLLGTVAGSVGRGVFLSVFVEATVLVAALNQWL
jgi:hypothetical protein